MSERPAPFGAFLAELKRRKVHRAALVYAVAAGGVWGAAEVAVPALGLPDSVITAIVIATFVGFPVALVLAWSFEIRLEEPAAAEPEVPVVGHRWGLVAGGVATVIAITAGIVILGKPGRLGGAVLQEGSTVVLADFTSTEGDEDVALAIRQALRVDLEHSEYVAVVGPGAVQSALRRMELPAGATVTTEVAQEIAVRDGYAAVLEGEVVSAGTGWLVTLRLTRSPEGESLLSDRETLADDADVLPGVNRLSRRFRDRIGESAASLAASPPLPELTTHSLEAIKAIAKAWDYYETGSGSGTPRRYFEEALAADSGFVQARAQLAVILSLNGDLSEAARLLEEVYPERNRLTPAERTDFLWIYHRVVEDDYEASSRVVREFLADHPDRFEDHQHELILDAMTTGDFGGAEALLLELKDKAGYLIPNMTHNLVFTWNALGKDDLVDSTLSARPEDWRAVARASLLREDWKRAASVARPEEFNDFEQHALPMLMALVRGRIGQFRGRAAALLDHFEGSGAGAAAAAWGLLYPGVVDIVVASDTATAARRLDEATARLPSSPSTLALRFADLAALVGRPEQARGHLADFDTLTDVYARRAGQRDRLVSEALISLAEAQPREAVVMLQRADRLRRLPRSALYFSLGRAYDALSLPDSAASAYEKVLSARWDGDRHRRLRYLAVTHERLGQLYDELDRPEDAIRHYEKFVEDWAEADAMLQPRVQKAREALERLQR